MIFCIEKDYLLAIEESIKSFPRNDWSEWSHNKYA